MVYFDSHVHTESSEDAEHSITYIAENAVDKGLMGFAVTDHCDIEQYKKQQFYKKIKQSVFHALMSKEIFADRLKIEVGVEIGQPLVDLTLVDRILSIGRFDFLLCALHAVNGQEDFYFMDLSRPDVDVDGLLRGYYDELARMAEWGQFDAMAHITYPFRYINGKYQLGVDMETYAPQIDEVLRLLAEKDLALEINTAGLRQPIGVTSPPLSLVRRFRELGGRMVTVGSDAHSAFDVGAGLAEGVAVAKAAGFSEYYYFENRRPVALAID